MDTSHTFLGGLCVIWLTVNSNLSKGDVLTGPVLELSCTVLTSGVAVVVLHPIHTAVPEVAVSSRTQSHALAGDDTGGIRL